MKSETRLQRDVLEELAWEPGIHAEDIGVTVTEGVVTLTGSVAGYPEKSAAQRAAQRVVGVKAVANDIHVVVPGPHRRTDTEIASMAADALDWNYSVPANRVRVAVRDGWITLEGELDWQFQREAAGKAVSHLTGVAGVVNAITVKPPVPPVQIREKIVAALKRTAEAEAARVTVEAHGGTVILGGSVRTWAEREDAERAAWSAPGVTTVESHIEVDAQELALL